MFTFKFQLLFLFVALFWTNARCDSICEFKNVDYKELIAGIDGKVKTSEPLIIDTLDGHSADITYTANNITFRGLKDCEVIHTKCDKNSNKELTFQYNIKCPRITVSFSFVVKGTISNIVVDGNGSQIDDLDDYILQFDGIYESVKGKDNKSRPVIKKYTFNTDLKGDVKYDITYPSNKEHEKAVNKAVKDIGKPGEKLLKTPIIDTIMKSFIKNFNAYSKSY